MNPHRDQTQLLDLVWRPTLRNPFRLRANDVIFLDGRLCRVIRVTDCAAVVEMNRKTREFTTRFDRHVRFQPPPVLIRISANAQAEILNRNGHKKRPRRERRPV